jgi:hypothetical protein
MDRLGNLTKIASAHIANKPVTQPVIEKKAEAVDGAAAFMARLFEARDYLHLAHLKVSGPGAYAAHTALGSAYDGLLGLADGIIEAYQGVHGLLDIKISASSYDGKHLEYIESLYKQIETDRSIFKESHIQNQIDEIQSLLASTQYKLKNLK